MLINSCCDSTASRLRDGDDSVLTELLCADGMRVRRMLLARFQGRLQGFEADVAMNVALYRVWRGRRAFDSRRGTLSNWFLALAVNAACDVIRSRRKFPCLVDPDRLEARVGPPQPERLAATARREGLADVELALERLPRAIVRVLLADQVVSDAELADELHVREGTIRVYRHRGLRRLRREIEAIRRERESSVLMHRETCRRILD